MKYRFVRRIFALVVLFFFVLSQPALASIGLKPGSPVRPEVYFSDVYLVYPDLKPGEEIKDSVIAINMSDLTKTYELLPFDGTIDEGGSFGFIDNIEDNTDIGSWITLETTTLTMAPHEEKRVNFVMKVPEDASPGDHVGAIAGIDRPNSGGLSGNNSIGFKLVSRIGLRVYATVAGEVKTDLRIVKARHKHVKGDLEITLDFENKGNVRLSPVIDAKLKSLTADYGEKKEFVHTQVFPAKTTAVSMTWPEKVPAFGRFVASFDINYKDGRSFFNSTDPEAYKIHYNYVFWVVPWGLVAIGGLFILGLILLWLLFRWFSVINRKRVPTEIYKVQSGDTLGTVAVAHGISAKSLVRFNALSWPFELLPGDYLLIPQTGAPKKSFWSGVKESFKRKRKTVQPIVSGEIKPMSGLPPRVVPKALPPVATETLIVEEGDTIEDVATFANVPILTIAKLNGLKAPFNLTTGQEIFVPIQTKKIEIPKSSKSSKANKIKSKPKAKLATSKGQSIEILRLPARSNLALKKARLKTLTDLEKRGKRLSEVKGIGPKAYGEIRTKLKKLGITLK